MRFLSIILTASLSLMLFSCGEDAATKQLRSELEQVMTDYEQGRYSGDSTWLVFDEATKTYLLESLKMARKRTEREIVTRVNADKYPYAAFKQQLFTYHSFLPTMAADSLTNEDLLDDYLFYLRIIDIGLLTIDDTTLDDFHLDKIIEADEQSATAQFSAKPNMFNFTDRVDFQIVFNKEDGAWRVNLPSTWSYTEQQVKQALKKTNANWLEYKDALIGQVNEMLEDGEEVSSYWVSRY